MWGVCHGMDTALRERGLARVEHEHGAATGCVGALYLQRDIVSKEEVGGGALVLRVVRDGRVELRQEEARLR
jgi:hypothetical protein